MLPNSKVRVMRSRSRLRASMSAYRRGQGAERFAHAQVARDDAAVEHLGFDFALQAEQLVVVGEAGHASGELSGELGQAHRACHRLHTDRFNDGIELTGHRGVPMFSAARVLISSAPSKSGSRACSTSRKS